MSDPLIEMRGIVKTYPGVRALDGVDFTLHRGEVHAIVGENGAGKSTLIRILTGAERREAGQVLLGGSPVESRTPVQAQRLGIATVYQEVNLVADLSVAENIMLGREPRTAWGTIDRRAMNRRAQEVAKGLGLRVEVRQDLRACSIALQQMVAVARAVDQKASALVLDEPTSSLDAGETAQLFSMVRRLRAQGLGVIFITHFLEQVYEISDRITILRGGRCVGTHAAADLPRLTLVSLMLGKAAEAAPSPRPGAGEISPTTPIRLEARGLWRRGAVEPLNLTLRAGEVLGLAGLLGSGRSEIVRLLFGVDARSGGTLSIGGRSIARHSPRRAIAAGMALAPEDRRAAGLVAQLSVRENMMLALQGARGWTRRLPRRQQKALAAKFIQALSISTPDLEKPVGQLSGGNQQKVSLARWLLMQPSILMLDEPTRGIDIGAKRQIESLIEDLRAKGMAIIFISGELEEVVRVSQRIVVLRDRHAVAELTGADCHVHTVMRRIAGETGGSHV
ncbi:MAG: sugar ABC transporter ATP-binding protein [Phycisphaerales bacterium]|nr:sugar ABC transporter ATP-binding protein [Phycisphaerales bacterium]